MIYVRTPIFYTSLLIVFVIFSIKELTTTKKLTNYTKWNNCIQDGIGLWKNSTDFSYHISNLTESCKVHLNLNIVELNNSKFHAFPVLESSTMPVHLTVGVSENIEGEAELKTKAPETLIFGTSPRPGIEKELFRKIGAQYPVAIGMDSGIVNMTIELFQNSTENYNETSIENASESLIQLDIIYFLKSVLKRNFYSSIWFNTSFNDLPNLLLSNGAFEKNGITVCQINFQIDEMETAKHILMDTVYDKRYAVLIDQTGDHINMFFVNFDNIKCKRELGIDTDQLS
ncbi:hypothetical protein L5515_013906 [Caenorhabditis briggsae]|uniref:Uncharacterized protein n=2 Tax=Caenorhabditis briggsae TaxID=6238 RepID=A0AAE9E9L3_CAEBR|nr:hypothetical protein L5515_013906 [Caenorhabditis briggsae]